MGLFSDKVTLARAIAYNIPSLPEDTAPNDHPASLHAPTTCEQNLILPVNQPTHHPNFLTTPNDISRYLPTSSERANSETVFF